MHQSRVVIFVCSAFEKALLCAHLLNQNLILPYLKSVLHPKYRLQACLLVLVKLLLMSNEFTVSLNFDRFWKTMFSLSVSGKYLLVAFGDVWKNLETVQKDEEALP